MASPTGSAVFSSVALLIISFIVLLILRHFLPLRTTPEFLLIPIFLALVLPASALILVPIDLASSARTEDEAAKGIWLPDRLVLVSWRIIYWLTFVLTWLALPILAEYMDSGHRDPKQKIFYSLRSNGRYQLMMLSFGVVGLIYISFTNGFDFTAIKALVMALAYVWGLILAIYLMGHGLVAVPRNMIRNASVAGRLKRVQGHAPKAHEKLEDAVSALQEVEAQVTQLKQRKTGSARDFTEWIDDLSEAVADPETRPLNVLPPETSPKVPAVITERYLADLSRRLARARHQRARYIEEWDRIVQQATDLQTILDAEASHKLVFPADPMGTFWSRLSILTPYLRYQLYIHVLPAIRIVFGAILSLASIAIVWSEIIKFPAPHLSAVSLTVIHHPNDKEYQIGLGGQLLATCWITYMCTCALSSITDIPLWNQRALVRRNTYAESACWYAGQIARLTVPLAYNFITFLPKDIYKNTTFYQFLGRLINLTPLGTWFDYLFPIFILLPVSATLFNLYGKIKNILGIDLIDDEDDEDNPSGFGTGGWREGRDLIARDLNGPGSTSLALASSSESPRPSFDGRLNANGRTASPRPSSIRNARLAAESASSSTTTSTSSPSAARASSPYAAQPQNQARAPLRPSGLRNSSTRPVLDPEPEEENFFTLFGRRVKNTFEGIETPKWMQQEQNAWRSVRTNSSGGGGDARAG
jgi:hypothetical protein